MNDWREREALHRYGVVRELCDERLTGAQRGVLVRAAAGRLHPHPSGELRTHGRATIDRWVRAWRAGGFEALKPRVRATGPLIAIRCCLRARPIFAARRTSAPARRSLRSCASCTAPMLPPRGPCQRHLARAELARGAVRAGEVLRPRTLRGHRAQRAVGRRRAARPDRHARAWRRCAAQGDLLRDRRRSLSADRRRAL